jgi:hypothetical protein
MSHRWQSYVLCAIAVALFLIPNFLWGNLYIVGGDDARLYYLFPFEYLKNFSFNVISGNTLGGNLGYMPVNYSAPIITFLLILKKLFPLVNTQLLMYGIIFSLGFLFFYFFLQEWITKKTPYDFWISILASLSYILSPYIARTYFQSQFISIFILMVLPGFLWLFIAGVKRKNTSLVVASSLLYSVFSATVYSFPWFLPVVLTLIPLYIYLAVRYGRYVWKMMFIFLGIFFLCNFYWIIHYIIPVIYKTGEANFTATLVTNSFIQQNNDVIAALTYLNRPVHQMIQYLRTSWQDRQGVTVVQSAGIIYLFAVAYAGVVVNRVKKDIRILYLVASFGLLLAMLFETPNFGQWNVQLFQFLNTHVPFFVIFRSMYDKFALAMAFHYAFTLFVSFVVIGEAKIKRKYLYFLVIVVFLVTVLRFLPYMHPDYKETGYSTRISALNQDYMDLVEYIKGLNTSSRFVWYPLTFGDYVYISDGTNPNHYYVGISPLQIFSRSGDLAGFYGLQTPGEPELHWNVLDLLKQKNYREVGNILKQQNVGYIIVNHEQMPQGGPFVLEQFDFVKSQDEEYLQTILGEKIRDFGKRYSLYTINREFVAPTVFLTDDTQVMFHRTPDGAYDIGPFKVARATNLILMEPYSHLWTLERLDGYKHETVRGMSDLAYGYGNAWVLDPARLGSPTLHVRAEFWPNRLIKPSIIISIASGVIAGLYCVIVWLMPRKKR